MRRPSHQSEPGARLRRPIVARLSVGHRVIARVLFTWTRDDISGHDRDADVTERGWVLLRHRQAPRVSIPVGAALPARVGMR